VGAGGFGVVYRGVLHAADVAVKLIDPSVAGAPQVAKQFKAEVDALSRARHQNIVVLLGSCPSAHMLVFEYVDCGTLEDRMLWGRARGAEGLQPLPWHQRVSVARQMASGLDYLHGLGIVHMWVAVGAVAVMANGPFEVLCYTKVYLPMFAFMQSQAMAASATHNPQKAALVG
jgi:serine/threonine protein kinase